MSEQPGGPVDPEFDAALADVAANSGLVDPDEVEQCRAVQRRAHEGGVAKTLADVFVDRKVVTSAQLKMLVDAAQKQVAAAVQMRGIFP